MKRNDKNNRKKKEESQDILGMIRARQEQDNAGSSSKLREFLNNLDKGTCEEDYTETPIYKIGFEDGETAGYEIASQRFQDELRALRTMIDAMIDSK